MSSRIDPLAERRAELERRLAALSPEKRAQLERARGVQPVARAAGIVPRPAGAPAPMSFAQELLWLLDRANPGMHGYNVPRTARLRGALNLDALQAALNGIVARHEVLRSTFDLVDGEPRQIVRDAAPVALHRIDLRDRPADAREAQAVALVRELQRRPFALERDPQLRASLLVLGDDDHVLLLESHHVSSDAWSRNILMRELSTLYDAHQRGEAAALAPLPVQYGDFAIWQRDTLKGDALEEHLAYWRDQLRDSPTLLELPTDRPRPVTPSFDGAMRSRMLPLPLLERLRALSVAQGSTLFVTLLAAFDVLLSRMSGQDDVVVGSPTAGRSQEGTEALIGYFANTLVLRTKLDGSPTFAELLTRVRETTLGAFEHQDVPYEKLAMELQRERALGRGGLFQVMFTLQDAELRTLQLPGLAFEPFGTARGATKFDLSLFMHERPEGLRAAFEYRTDLFDAVTIDRMLARLEVLLEGIAANPHAPVSSLPVLPDEERRLLLDEWSTGESQQLETDTLHDMIALQAARTPNAVAVEAESSSGEIVRLTFAELESRASALARHLAGMGVGPNVGVGICIDRSLDLVVAMLGVLKSGSYYLPLDPDYPADRLAFMLEDANVPVLLTVESLESSVPRVAVGGPRVVVLDREWELIAASARRAAPPVTPASAEGLAYMIYTSGSTGRPKGVMIPHRAVVNYLTWMRAEFPLDTTDAVLQKAPASFDACIWEFFLPLVSGARLVLARPGAHQDPVYLLSALATHDVTLLQLVPSQLAMMLETAGADAPAGLPRLRRLFLGGEALPSELLSRLAAVCPSLPVTNLYGPTEATVYATHWSVTPSEWTGGSVPIGKPIANTSIYLMATSANRTATNELVPIGVPGELCIGGMGVAHGYLKRPELTDEKFVVDSFAKDAARSSHSPLPTHHPVLYRTGDRARYRADGTLEYLGRIDNQVKLRGFRVELGEIETALTQQPGIQSAVVLVREDTPGDQRLVAYCIAIAGADTSGHAPAALRRALKSTLPEYMVPTAFVWLQEWPMNANGKLDRKALPAPDAGDTATAERVAPRTETERAIAEMWSDVLQCEVGLTDDFFELGGHSLLALRVLTRVGQRFGVRVPLRAIFDASSLESFAARVDELAASAGPSEAAIPRVGDEAPLTHLQELFWLVERNSTRHGVYNVADQWKITGTLDLDALRRALDMLVQRHEALRTNIIDRDTGPVQTIQPARPVTLDLIDLAAFAPDARDRELHQILERHTSAPFDLATDLLLRTTLVRTSPSEHVLVLVSHHVVYDGWSRGILLRELSALYALSRGERAPALRPPAVRFVDYAAWERARLDAPTVARQVEEWLDRLADVPLDLELPTDRPRPSAPTFEGGKRTVVFSLELLARLKQIARDNDATLFMVLVAGFQMLLHRYSGQKQLVIGTIVAGRPRPELEGTVGNFVNSVPLRASFADDPTFLELLARVKDEYLYASEHAELPFDTLTTALQRERGAEATGFGQIHFILQNNAPSGLRLSGTDTRQYSLGTSTTKFDLMLSMGEQKDGLRAAMQFRSSMFDASSIDRMLSHLGTQLEAASVAPATRVSRLPILAPGERELLELHAAGPRRDYPIDEAIHALIERQVDRTPDAPALTFEGETLSYAEMDALANQLARLLRERGVLPGHLVGVCLDRSLEMVVSLLAISKAGGAYVPLDPEYPRERLSFMLEDSAPTVTLTRRRERESLPPDMQNIVELDDEQVRARLAQMSTSRLGEHVSGDSLAYVIYTSGSTGRPKGAPNRHRAVVNRLLWGQETYQYTAKDAVLQKTPYSFDVSVPEFFGPLLAGARLVIARPGGHRDPEYLQQIVATERITSIHFVPSMLGAFLSYVDPSKLATVRLLPCSGEGLPPAMATRAYELLPPDAKIYNLYGPTECAIEITNWLVPRDPALSMVPIGRPMTNSRCYVLDATLQPVPIGVPGELYLAGRQVGVGYLNRPELTAERFVDDPHADPALAPDTKMYRTGDRARWLPDGAIDFMGRFDFQVKFRGVRIELGEIESVMNADPDVSESLALVREPVPGDQRLLCYYVPVPGTTPDEERIKAALRKVLPQAMMPSALIALDAFPTTRSGKTDRQALPMPSADTFRTVAYVPPRTTIEHELVHIWEALLDRRPIGIQEDFFELGGHSLLAVRMMAEIARVRGRHVPLTWLFESSTIRALGARIDEEVQATKEPPLVALQAEAKGTPIAFVHGDVRGAGWYCRRLAPLVTPDAPFLVLPTLGSEGDTRTWRIETMAAHHVAELRKVQPRGPYRLAGFCVGGIIAFEMARQLREVGETVERLIIIDGGAGNARVRYAKALVALMPGLTPSARLARQSSLMKRLRRYDLRIRQVTRRDTRQQLRWIANNVERRARRLMPLFGMAISARDRTPMESTDSSGLATVLTESAGLNVLIRQAMAVSAYIPSRYDGRIDLVWAEEDADVKRVDPTRSWWRVADDVQVHTVVAHHIGLITKDLPKLASVLRAILERDDGAAGVGDG